MTIDELARLAAKSRRARRATRPDYPRIALVMFLVIAIWVAMFEIFIRWG